MNEEVANILTKNLIPKEFEKNQFGEVFTPLYFIEQMLDELPASVWKEKSLKWFDPACGIGNFPIVVYYGVTARFYRRRCGKEQTHHRENALHERTEQKKRRQLQKNIRDD